MHKIKLSIALFLIFCIHHAHSQASITNPKNSWIVYSLTVGGSQDYQSYRYDGDTTINNIKYLILLIGKKYITLIRNENKTKIYCAYPVYQLRDSSVKIQGEYLLYDFSLKVGDSIINKIKVNDTSSYVVTAYVTKIQDSVKLLGQTGKLFTIRNSNTRYPGPHLIRPDQWHEIIGSTQGILNPLNPLPDANFFEIVYDIACFSDSTICKLVGTQDILIANITMNPNPVSENLRVEYNTSVGKLKTGTVLDISGKIVKTIRSSDTGVMDMDVRNFPNGLYFLNLQFDTGFVSKKFVVQR